ncbi:MAG: PD-(D/E)XK nuclease family protein [Elusimicrobiota bacterium]
MQKLSHSSIQTYLDCPKKWHYRYVEKIPEKPKYFFSFGKSMHSALEFLYKAELPPSLEGLLRFYYENWINEGYETVEQEDAKKKEGEEILRRYYEKNVPGFRPPLHTELKFGFGRDFLVGGVAVRGVIDRVDLAEGGRIAILDYKTGKPIPRSRVQTDDQLTLYQMACKEILGREVESLILYHLPSQTPHRSGPHGPELVEALTETVVRVAERIRSEDFTPEPSESKCGWCDYKTYCPVWSQPRSPQPEPKFDAKTDDQLGKLVDRYGQMKADIQTREEEAEKVKESIVAALRGRGYVRAFGDHFEATLHDEDRWEFHDKRKVLDAIQRAGFWDRVIAPSAPAVQKLLKDPNIPLDLRDRLQRLGDKVTHAVLRLKKIEEEE